MKFDTEEIFTKATGFDDRKKISLYLSVNIYKKFQKICKAKKAPVSKVLELVLDSFLKATEKNQ